MLIYGFRMPFVYSHRRQVPVEYFVEYFERTNRPMVETEKEYGRKTYSTRDMID